MRRLAQIIALAALPALAQTSAPTYGATTVNLGGMKDTVKIDLLRFSTDAERDQIVAAWTSPRAATAAGQQPAADSSDPFGSFRGRNNNGANNDAGQAGRGAAPAKITPEQSLAETLAKAPTVGYFWVSSEVAGYPLRYAVRVAAADGGERLILATDRRLGRWNDGWRPAGTPTNYEFSIIELRVNAKGDGEGKISATAKVSADAAAKTLALENYSALPVVLGAVKRR